MIHEVSGQLTVIRRLRKNDLLVQCKCGNRIILNKNQFRRKKYPWVHCKRCPAPLTAAVGILVTPEYDTWNAMKSRCKDKQNPNYGGRGIEVCAEWVNDFSRFLKDMGYRPIKHSLDRIDPNKGYSPDNCRWATIKEQAMNKRNVRTINYKGKVMSIKDLCAELGLDYQEGRAYLKELNLWDK